MVGDGSCFSNKESMYYIDFSVNKKMTDEEIENWENVYAHKKQEGFDYCFRHYSSFKEIKDEKFHELRISYLLAAKELEQYIDKKYKESQEF
jgi:hypothetical protein